MLSCGAGAERCGDEDVVLDETKYRSHPIDERGRSVSGLPIIENRGPQMVGDGAAGSGPAGATARPHLTGGSNTRWQAAVAGTSAGLSMDRSKRFAASRAWSVRRAAADGGSLLR